MKRNKEHRGNVKVCNVWMSQSHYMVGLWAAISSAQLKRYALRKPNGVEDGLCRGLESSIGTINVESIRAGTTFPSSILSWC